MTGTTGRGTITVPWPDENRVIANRFGGRKALRRLFKFMAGLPENPHGWERRAVFVVTGDVTVRPGVTNTDLWDALAGCDITWGRVLEVCDVAPVAAMRRPTFKVAVIVEANGLEGAEGVARAAVHALVENTSGLMVPGRGTGGGVALMLAVEWGGRPEVTRHRTTVMSNRVGSGVLSGHAATLNVTFTTRGHQCHVCPLPRNCSQRPPSLSSQH